MTQSWALNLFDRLHIGHQILIDRLSEMPSPVAAISDGELVGKDLELRSLIQPLKLRAKNLEQYLHSIDLGDQIRIETLTKFDDLLKIDGAVNFLMFQGPCCSEIEEKGLELRKESLAVDDRVVHLKPVMAGDGGKVSSARIRKGEIDREGRCLKGTKEPPRRLPDKGRSDLKGPKGDVFSSKDGTPEKQVVIRIRDERPKKVIAVGDVTSATVIAEGFTPDVCFIDGITKRGDYDAEFSAEKEYVVYNPPATIYPETWSVTKTALKSKQKVVVRVEGEEDLMGFPAVLLAPNGSVMIYGQPDVGIVWVPVNEENKKLARNLLDNMTVIS